MFNKLLSFASVVLLGAIVLGLAVPGNRAWSAFLAMPQSSCESVVLSKPDDPYYALAEEVAARENAPLVHALPEALACRPVFLLWVASPAFLSDAVMIEFGLAMKGQPLAISPGIITASTIQEARSL